MASLRWKSQENMDTSHRGLQSGHNTAISEEIPTMVCDSLRCSWKLKIAGKWPSLWQGLKTALCVLIDDMCHLVGLNYIMNH